MVPMKKNAKLNYIYNLIYQVVLLITPLITTPYVSRVLGEYGVGQYSFSHSIASYFILFGGLGFGYYAQREIAKKQNDKQVQSVIFWEIIIARAISVFVSIAVYLALILFGVFGNQYELLFKLLLINIVATAFDITFLFQGNEEFGVIALKNVVIRIIGITLIFVFVKQYSDLWIYTLCQSLILIVGNLSLWTRLPKILTRVKASDLRIKRHLVPTLRLFVPTIAVSINAILDKTLLGVLVEGVDETGKNFSFIENGNYEQSDKIIQILLSLLTALGAVMYPKNSQAVASGDRERLKSNVYKALSFVCFLGFPLTFGISAVSINFSPWFFGEGYLKVPYLMMVLSPKIVIIGLSDVLGMQYLLPLEKDKKFTIALIIGAIANVSLNFLLIPFLWSYGACIATVVAELLITFTMILFARKEIKFSLVIKSTWKYFLAAALMFGVVFTIGHFLSASILNTFILVVMGILVYVAALLIFKDAFLFSILKMVRDKIKRTR